MRKTTILLLVLAACGRSSPPSRVTVVAAPPVAPPRVDAPRWALRRVVPNAIEVRAGSVTVAAGEGWSQVARRSGVPVGALLAANGIAAATQATVGQSLRVPAGRVHTVAPGETGIAIARAYGASWTRVVATNRLTPPYTLEIGDQLLLPSRATVAAMSVEDRAKAFRIDIDDLITGAEPAGGGAVAAGSTRVGPKPRPAPSRPPVAVVAAPKPAPSKPVATALAPLPPLPTGTPSFAWPIEGRILSSFGPKPGGRYNDGVNLKASAGTAVRAAADGVVAYAGDAVAGFGNLILIKHADGWVSAYGHNEALLVARGARVAKGDIIARSGATGAVDEPQLHFELRRGRAATDPVKLLPSRSL